MFYFLAFNSGSILSGISGHCKAKYRSMHGTSDNLFDSYLQEYNVAQVGAMFYLLAFNSGSVISSNDISVYLVTGIGFVCWDFSKVFSRTSRLDIADLTLRAVIK